MANLNLNKVILGGRLTSTPELKQTLGGIPVCSFGIAVNRRSQKDGESQADFINCIAWRQNGEFVSRYFRKGSSICITGSLQTRTWTDKHGERRYVTEVIAEEIGFVDAKGEAASRPHDNIDADTSDELPF